ncbi:3-oxo-5-alpha-steroid 4-dehydrogenase family protein [Striga asiatica]|uniref:3-oxo-5-alpha-steroid 4-dehydrogenase family protein n=1 Tax=Striga asiatica TaxID=4170 RepID=A0A5A7QJB6_STRAF|nr:3-oxo-5-alpha-steroid 4-dehydrogenase family protein [Striga asiatica]
MAGVLNLSPAAKKTKTANAVTLPDLLKTIHHFCRGTTNLFVIPLDRRSTVALIPPRSRRGLLFFTVVGIAASISDRTNNVTRFVGSDFAMVCEEREDDCGDAAAEHRKNLTVVCLKGPPAGVAGGDDLLNFGQPFAAHDGDT